MRISAIIVGIDGWEKYTLPLIRSIGKHEPDCLVTVVDNFSEEPYPYSPIVEGNQHYTLSNLTERVCYSQAINHGKAMSNEADWYIVLSNDVICRGPFRGYLERYSGDDLVGPQLWNEHGLDWLVGWCVFVPHKIWEAVRGWDENYIMSSWEDVDFSHSARKLGYGLVEDSSLPFSHLDQKQRFGLPGYAGSEAQNYAYFMRKHGMYAY